MSVIDKVLNDYSESLSLESRVIIGGALYEGEKAVLEILAPKDYSDDEVLAFVYYHLHGEELPVDFFFQRRMWRERNAGK